LIQETVSQLFFTLPNQDPEGKVNSDLESDRVRSTVPAFFMSCLCFLYLTRLWLVCCSCHGCWL